MHLLQKWVLPSFYDGSYTKRRLDPSTALTAIKDKKDIIKFENIKKNIKSLIKLSPPILIGGERTRNNLENLFIIKYLKIVF